jgi:hypothetical protein
MNPMKKYLSTFIILFLSGICLILTTCIKNDESEAQHKMLFTIKLNNDIRVDSLKSTVIWLQNFGTRFALADNHRDVAIRIKKRFTGIGYTTCRLDSFLISKTYKNVDYQQWQYNVIATLEGNVYPDSVCIIGGHYDNILSTGDPFSVAYGANDNASGVAAALEIARVMKKNKYSPANTIEFIAFGSEEIGLLGSYAYANSSSQSSKKIKLMLNNDMIACQPGTSSSSWIVNIIDYDNSHNLRIEAEKICRRFTVLNYFNDNVNNKRSDSYPFFINGFKSLFFFSGNSDLYYHTLNDKADKYNFEYCREIARLCCAILVDKN